MAIELATRKEPVGLAQHLSMVEELAIDAQRALYEVLGNEGDERANAPSGVYEGPEGKLYEIDAQVRVLEDRVRRVSEMAHALLSRL